MTDAKILVVDDDEKILFAFRQVLVKEGYETIVAKDGVKALDLVESEKPDVVFMDITMPKLDGLATLELIKERYHSIPVIIITGQGTMHTAIKAMQLGAFEYVTKPLSVTTVRDIVKRAISNIKSTVASNPRYQAETLDSYELVGDSIKMQEIYKLIGTVSTTPNTTSVLIVGESGTGKELVARAIHSYSSPEQAPFVAINCTAFPESLLESEIFGHEKGTFTGAAGRKLGKFEIAGGGTIFLDEIGDLPAKLQLKLLRVLQEREFERLGGHTSIKIDARFIAATNQDIESKVQGGQFREDLLYRLNSVLIALPPLRERAEDILQLADYFLNRYNLKLKKSIKGFSEKVMSQLKSYSYPGNVRELENFIERAVMMTKGSVVLPESLGDLIGQKVPAPAQLPLASDNFSEAREHILNLFEQQFITTQLSRYGGNVSAAARESGMSRQNFHRLMLKYNIQASRE